MKYKYFLKFLVIILINIYPVYSYSINPKIKLAIATARNEDDVFFSLVVDFMKAACDNLGMEIVPLYAHGDHFSLVDEIEKGAIEKKFDAVVILNFKKQLLKTANILEKNKIPFIVYNAGFDPTDNVGEPRQKFKYWIAEMLPNDEEAGYLLAKIIANATPKLKDGKKHLIAMGGNLADEASIKRVNGLNRFINETKEKVALDQITNGNWNKEIAKEKFPLLHKRYPNLIGYWTANDAMVLGIYGRSMDIHYIL